MRALGPLSRDILYLAAGRAGAMLLSFVTLALLARKLGPVSLGSLQFALAAFFYVGFAVDLGLPILGARDYAIAPKKAELVSRVLTARLFLAAVVAIGLVLFALSAPIGPAARMMAIAMALWATATAASLEWVLQGSERFAALGLVETGSAAFQLLAAIILVHGPSDLVPAFGVIGVGLWATTIGAWFATRKEGPRASGSLQADVIRRAIPLGIAALAVGIYYSVDALLLGILRGQIEVAYYAIAYRVVTPLLVLAVIAGTVVLPALARATTTRTLDAVPVLRSLSAILLCLGLPAAAGTTLVAGPLVKFVFGPVYLPAAVPLALLVWSVIAVYANAPFAYLMIARGQHREYMIATVGGALVNTVLNLALIPSLGVIGAAVATIVTEIVVVTLVLWWTRDVAPPLLAAAFWLAAPATGVMALCTWPFHESLLAIPIGLVGIRGGPAPNAGIAKRWTRDPASLSYGAQSLTAGFPPMATYARVDQQHDQLHGHPPGQANDADHHERDVSQGGRHARWILVPCSLRLVAYRRG